MATQRGMNGNVIDTDEPQGNAVPTTESQRARIQRSHIESMQAASESSREWLAKKEAEQAAWEAEWAKEEG